jgi:hypothetical protein
VGSKDVVYKELVYREPWVVDYVSGVSRHATLFGLCGYGCLMSFEPNSYEVSIKNNMLRGELVWYLDSDGDYMVVVVVSSPTREALVIKHVRVRNGKLKTKVIAHATGERVDERKAAEAVDEYFRQYYHVN